MEIDLFTADGYVTTAITLPFVKAPDVMMWGQRLFVACVYGCADKADAADRCGDCQRRARYTEAFFCAVIQTRSDPPPACRECPSPCDEMDTPEARTGAPGAS